MQAEPRPTARRGPGAGKHRPAFPSARPRARASGRGGHTASGWAAGSLRPGRVRVAAWVRTVLNQGWWVRHCLCPRVCARARGVLGRQRCCCEHGVPSGTFSTWTASSQERRPGFWLRCFVYVQKGQRDASVSGDPWAGRGTGGSSKGSGPEEGQSER